MARFAPPGHLVFWRAGAVLAVPFDSKRRRVDGEPVRAGGEDGRRPSSGVAYAALAADGTLAYVTGGASLGERRLMLTDRAGKARPVPVPLRSYHYPRFSPDGKRIAVDDRTRPWQRRRHLDLRDRDGRALAADLRRRQRQLLSGLVLRREACGVQLRPRAPGRVFQKRRWLRGGGAAAARGPAPASARLVARRLTSGDQPGISELRCPHGVAPRPARNSLREGRRVSGLLAGRKMGGVCAPISDAAPQILVKPVAGTGGKIQITSDWGTFPVGRTGRSSISSDNRKVVAVEARTNPTFHAGRRARALRHDLRPRFGPPPRV